MKKILVPIDFSEYSEYAMETAAILAKKNNAGIIVMHMIVLSESILSKDESQEMFEAIYYMKLARKRFDEFLDRDYLEGIPIETTVQNCKEFQEINDVVDDFDVDLIVMGSHGVTGFKEVFIGSNAEKVVRTAKVPVLVVKDSPFNFEIKKVIFACDFNPDFVEPFKKAWNFFKEQGAEFQIVFVNLPNRFMSTNEMKSNAAKFFIQSRIIELNGAEEDVVFYNDHSLEHGIFTFSKEFNADVIAIPTHGRRGLSHFFSENIGEALVNHSDIAMMTFKV